MRPLPDPAFVAAAARRPQIWRLALGLGLFAVLYFTGTTAAFLLSGTVGVPGPEAPIAEDFGTTPREALVILFSFVFMALAAWAAARLLHGRTLREMVGPLRPVLSEAGLAAAVLILVNIPFLALGVLTLDLRPNLDASLWLALLAPALAGVALQTFAEELAFRGYLQGQLMARFASRWVWLVLPAVLFGLGHYDASLGGTAWAVIAAITLFGLITGDLTARTGRLGAAWGLHLANNCIALLLVASDDTLSGLALYRSPIGVADAPWLLLLDAATLVLVWLVVIRLLPRLARARPGA